MKLTIVLTFAIILSIILNSFSTDINFSFPPKNCQSKEYQDSLLKYLPKIVRSGITEKEKIYCVHKLEQLAITYPDCEIAKSTLVSIYSQKVNLGMPKLDDNYIKGYEMSKSLIASKYIDSINVGKKLSRHLNYIEYCFYNYRFKELLNHKPQIDSFQNFEQLKIIYTIFSHLSKYLLGENVSKELHLLEKEIDEVTVDYDWTTVATEEWLMNAKISKNQKNIFSIC